MGKYDDLSADLKAQIRSDQAQGWKNPCRCRNREAIRRDMVRDADEVLWRPPFVRDTEKILHMPFYNRYADKTQVFSLYRNDDITRRSLHVQLVSRIARSIGAVLGLNLDLIEAISLGHDIGHAPFGHAGERFLSALLEQETGRSFHHNVQGVRVLDTLFARNVSLQTLDGILCHNGELPLQEYRPRPLPDFTEFDALVESCYWENNAAALVPATMEGCLVRICDIIAYLGKDRQDARRTHLIESSDAFHTGAIGKENAEIIRNLTVRLIENSYGKDYLMLDQESHHELVTAKNENYEQIYKDGNLNQIYNENIRPMFHDVYYRLLQDVTKENRESIVFRHHIAYIEENRQYYPTVASYREEENNLLVADYIASMTDDYFIDLYHYLFPNGTYHVEYTPYF